MSAVVGLIGGGGGGSGSGKVRRYRVEGIVDPAQGLALEFDKALDEEAVDTRHLLHQLNALDDEAAVTSHLLGQPNNVLDDEAAVTSNLLDQLNNALDDETHYARSRHKILAAAAT